MQLEQFNAIIGIINSDSFSNLDIRRQVNNLLKKYEYTFILAYLLKEVEYVNIDHPVLAGLILGKPSNPPAWANFLTGSYHGFWTWHELQPVLSKGLKHSSDGQASSIDTGIKNPIWSFIYDKNGIKIY